MIIVTDDSAVSPSTVTAVSYCMTDHSAISGKTLGRTWAPGSQPLDRVDCGLNDYDWRGRGWMDEKLCQTRQYDDHSVMLSKEV